MSDDLLERLGRGCNCGRCKLDLCCCAAMEEAKAEIERLTINGIHTCHDECQRVPCMQRREIVKLREVLREVTPPPHFGESEQNKAWWAKARAALGETK